MKRSPIGPVWPSLSTPLANHSNTLLLGHHGLARSSDVMQVSESVTYVPGSKCYPCTRIIPQRRLTNVARGLVSSMRTAPLTVCAATLGIAATFGSFLLTRENPRAIHISML